MKRIISMLIVGTVVLGLVACNNAPSDTTSESQTVSSSIETTTEPTEDADRLPMSFDEVVNAVKANDSDWKINIPLIDEDVEKNKEIGIVNAVALYVDKPGNTSFYLLEFDTKSEQYKSLTPGKLVTMYFSGAECKYICSAINKQYVICIIARNTKLQFEEQAPYTVATAKSVYDTFVYLPDGKMKINLEGFGKAVLDQTGDFYDLVSKADESVAKDNLSVGIVDYVQYSILTDKYAIQVMIFEFDMNSDVYKNLKAGEQMTYYIDGALVVTDVAAIKQQFVLTLSASKVVDGAIDSSSMETEPPYTIIDAEDILKLFENTYV